MQSYCEVKTGKSINWYDRLNELKQLKRLKHYSYSTKHYQYHHEACSWVTCACGNMCDIIPRVTNDEFSGPGRPQDHELAQLGAAFPKFISADDYEGALDCLDKIEKRSEILIQQELKKRAHAELHAEAEVRSIN